MLKDVNGLNRKIHSEVLQDETLLLASYENKTFLTFSVVFYIHAIYIYIKFVFDLKFTLKLYNIVR